MNKLTENLDEMEILRLAGTMECCDECGETILRDGTCPSCDELDEINQRLSEPYKNIQPTRNFSVSELSNKGETENNQNPNRGSRVGRRRKRQ